MTTGSYSTHAQNLRVHVNQNFSTAPVQFPNTQTFNRPSDSEWVRMLILESSESFAADMADKPRFRFPGILLFECFTPVGQGDGPIRDIVDELAGLFRQVTIGNTRFETPGVNTVGVLDTGDWYKMNVTCPYERDIIDFDND